MMRKEIRKYWLVVRRIWIIVGLSATAVFVIWSLLAYRADADAKAAMISDDIVNIIYSHHIWQFTPSESSKLSTMLFFPGALVDPTAYAPLARAMAEQGYPVLLVTLPWRGAFGGAESSELQQRISSALALIADEHSVVIGGHSRGAVVASGLIAQLTSKQQPVANKLHPAGLILIGTTHPRDVNLSNLDVPVTKIVGTRDGLASPAKVEQNASLLPAQTRWVWVEGGNHSQFGWYGFQPMDNWAEISAAEQREIMIQAVSDVLQNVN